MAMFEGPPPPLLPILDAAGLWDDTELTRIKTTCEKLRIRFPQFRFHICTVMLPAETSLPLFGFWLLNACPLDGGETTEDRSWTVLLLLNARTGQAAVVPAYAAEHWVTDEDWSKILTSMAKPWKSGKTANAVIGFLKTTGAFLDQTWKTRGLRRSKRSRS